MTVHDVNFTKTGPTNIPPELVADVPRESPAADEVEVFAAEYRLVGGQRRQKGNRYLSARRTPAKGVEILYVTPDGRRGTHRRFWGDAVEYRVRASLGVPPAALEPIEPHRRHRVSARHSNSPNTTHCPRGRRPSPDSGPGSGPRARSRPTAATNQSRPSRCSLARGRSEQRSQDPTPTRSRPGSNAGNPERITVVTGREVDRHPRLKRSNSH